MRTVYIGRSSSGTLYLSRCTRILEAARDLEQQIGDTGYLDGFRRCRVAPLEAVRLANHSPAQQQRLQALLTESTDREVAA